MRRFSNGFWISLYAGLLLLGGATLTAQHWLTTLPVPDAVLGGVVPLTGSGGASSQAFYVGQPVKIRIPAIRVESDIQQVGLARSGNMDIPASPYIAGWFRLGVRPGRDGNAVIAGHLNTAAGTPGIFWDLDKLVPGDEVLVTDASGSTLVFRVARSQPYDWKHAPLQEIFGPAEKKGLNLITCNGSWNAAHATYSQRLVVYTEFAERR